MRDNANLTDQKIMIITTTGKSAGQVAHDIGDLLPGGYYRLGSAMPFFSAFNGGWETGLIVTFDVDREAVEAHRREIREAALDEEE